ncbi:hypothetical protein K2P96_00540, partial [Patescibacteria group bacterium]|nr:hypothetical protein [Patescibacteria group bacterium]
MIDLLSKNNFLKAACFLSLPFLFFCIYTKQVYAFPPPVSDTVAVSAVVGSTVTPLGPSANGSMQNAVRFSGEAYPNATVSVLKNGVVVATVTADKDGVFSVTLEEKYQSTIVYTIFAVDLSGNKSLLLNYPIVVYSGFLTHLSGIRFAPTIVTDKAEVKSGDYLTVSGFALPNKEMQIFIDGDGQKVFTLSSTSNGFYKIVLPMLNLPKGDYVTYIKYFGDSRASKLVKFSIGAT